MPKPRDDSPEAILEANKICRQILSDIDELPDNDSAAQFGESISEKVLGIQSTIERTGGVTEGQITALENMYNGVQKWMH